VLTLIGGTCRFDRYIPKVMVIGDSIPYGVGCTNIASWRETLYFLAQAAGTPFVFVGSQSFAGGAGGLAVNPQCECYPGAAVRNDGTHQSLLALAVPKIPTYAPDIIILQGETNDAGPGPGGLGDSAPTILTSLQTQATNCWSLRVYAHTKIIQLTAIQRFDDAGANATLATVRAGLPAMIAGLSFSSAVTLVDIWNSVPFPSGYSGDNLHPNDAGDTATGNVIWAYLQALLPGARGAT